MPVDPAKPFDLQYRVDPTWVNLRLDQFVKAMVPAISRTKIQAYAKAGRIEVNGEARPGNWRVRLNDQVTLRCNIPQEGADAGKFIPLEIIHEDDDLIVLSKQPGLVVHPVALSRHNTLLNALYWRYKDILPAEQSIALANRLDKYTSGLILATKNARAKQLLQEQFEYRRTKKKYHALVHGLWAEKTGEIDLPLGRAGLARDRCKMCVRHDAAGKPSLTRYRVLEEFPARAAEEPALTLVELSPHTGRQHQLRVHCAEKGHPLVADERYGRDETLIVGATEAESILGRFALHAVELTFKHPASGQDMTFTAPLAADMAAALAGLRAGHPRRLGPPPERPKRLNHSPEDDSEEADDEQ